MMKMILLFVLVTMTCTVFGQGRTPYSENFDVVKYVEDYIKKHTKKPAPKGEFETAYEWQARVREEKDEQRKELMHKALYELYGSPFEAKINLRLGQYNIERQYFPMKTNGLGTYMLPADRKDGAKWREKWNSGKFSIRNTYGLVNGKPRLVFCAAVGLDYDQEIYLFDKEMGKFIEFVWRNGSWEIGKKFTEFKRDWRIWEPGKDNGIEENPQFNGNINKWIRDNLKYPVIAQENGIFGKVYVEFIIEEDGSITDVEVVQSVDPSLDEEAIRLVKAMPKWTPGKVAGKPVQVLYKMPINFTLSK